MTNEPTGRRRGLCSPATSPTCGTRPCGASTVAESLTRQGFNIRAQIIWAKERLVIGRGDYQWQHEPCWYAVRTKGNWTGDRKQTTLWSISSRDQDADTPHSTQKPVECMRRPMLNNSDPGQAVYDPFLGSGTTLIAAETTGRMCVAIERELLHVDVAVRRWQAFTGRAATLFADGRPFDAIAAERLAGTKTAKAQASAPSVSEGGEVRADQSLGRANKGGEATCEAADLNRRGSRCLPATQESDP
jgi:hypothetical protein